jgi:hypothetical protein
MNCDPMGQSQLRLASLYAQVLFGEDVGISVGGRKA